jgi:hypothetical protein
VGSAFHVVLLVALLAYIASWVALSALLFPIMAAQGIEKLGAFSTFRSIPPAVGAVFICAWLNRKEADWNHFTNYLAITSLSIGAIAGFASPLLSGGVDDVSAVMTIAFDVMQRRGQRDGASGRNQTDDSRRRASHRDCFVAPLLAMTAIWGVMCGRPPARKSFHARASAASCGHVCGLLVRHDMAAGPDGNRRIEA